MKRYFILFLIILLSGCSMITDRITTRKELEKKVPLCAILVPNELRYGALGEDLKDGVLLGLNDIDSKIYDTDADPIQAIEQAKFAIFNDGVTCIIGPLLSSTAIPVACISELAGVPMISPTATEQRLPFIGEFIYKLYSPIDVEEIALARYIMSKLRFYRIAVLASDDSYGKDITLRFKNEIEKLGGIVSNVFYYTPGSSNLRETMLSLRDIDVNAIFIPAYESDIPGIASQFAYYEVLDSTTAILGLKEWGYPEIVDEYKNYLPHVILTSLSDFGRYPEFEKAFKDRYNKIPTEAAIMGYSAAKIFVLALKDGANSRKSLYSWLSKSKSIQPLSGISLSKEGLISYIRIFEVSRGELRELK
ncbi:ABC transporter substrate-binding protein [candidate division WOR-3 bacterium]|nr:ABC transporter substrate-binding protein [candidate division WOR-3 bacterium]